MRMEFMTRQDGPERLVCHAELVFEEGPLAGAKLVGFCLWQTPEGEAYVTLPARAFGSGSERRYFDFLRSVDGTGEVPKRIKAWILEAYHRYEETRTGSGEKAEGGE